jgi:hypothetical protein
LTEEDVKKLIADALKQPKEVTEIEKIEKVPIDVERLFTIWKTSELKKTDILLVKSDNEHVSFDYASEFKELFDRLVFTPIIVTIRANDSFEIVTEEKLNAMGYYKEKK